jgi:hypothetical protein
MGEEPVGEFKREGCDLNCLLQALARTGCVDRL